MGRLEDQVVRAHFEAKAAWDAGATKEENGTCFNGYPSRSMALGLRSSKSRWSHART